MAPTKGESGFNTLATSDSALGRSLTQCRLCVWGGGGGGGGSLVISIHVTRIWYIVALLNMQQLLALKLDVPNTQVMASEVSSD